MLRGVRKTVLVLAAAPLVGLVLAGCGGSSGDESKSAATTTTDAVNTATDVPTATTSGQRFDITAVMVCDAVQSALDSAGELSSEPEQRAKDQVQFQKDLVTSLETAFRGSKTPRATITTVKVDKLMDSGCPGLRVKALTTAKMSTMAMLKDVK
ncbi:hypothetical protein [Kineosporia sp. NBRC 101731]|uniref:hypothetical protein n=1 Tax=Kineosporia sp. NBRC 101731 TaxID=3032199 RepID=UPI0024A4AC57|nr:hypothetical protein [Kineosporia sp. NBRC 101731]GLY30051.1 hypothetical protein Kisp02_34160 [Kineosporia sp. NBRC 101731]